MNLAVYTNFVFIVKQADKCSSVSPLCRAISSSDQHISDNFPSLAPKGLCTYRCILVFFVATCIILLEYQSSEIALMHVFSKYKVAKFYINEFPRQYTVEKKTYAQRVQMRRILLTNKAWW